MNDKNQNMREREARKGGIYIKIYGIKKPLEFDCTERGWNQSKIQMGRQDLVTGSHQWPRRVKGRSNGLH